MTLGMMASDVEQRIDFDAMRKYKQERIQSELREKDLGAVICTTRATQRQKDLYKRANDWLQASIDVVRPGITTSDIARQWPAADRLGYPDELAAAGLCVGHGIGLSVHEKPFITRLLLDHPTPIRADMHFALETFAGEGEDGARIESQVIVTGNGHKVITRWPADELMVCAPR